MLEAKNFVEDGNKQLVEVCISCCSSDLMMAVAMHLASVLARFTPFAGTRTPKEQVIVCAPIFFSKRVDVLNLCFFSSFSRKKIFIIACIIAVIIGLFIGIYYVTK